MMIGKKRRTLAFFPSRQDGFSNSFFLCAVFPKILIGCSEEEKDIVYEVHNETTGMKGILISR